MQNYIDTLLFVVNWIWATLQNPHVVAFEPAGFMGVLSALAIFVEGKNKRIDSLMPFIAKVTAGIVWAWMFCFWQFYLPPDPAYLPEYGMLGHMVVNLVGSAMFAFIAVMCSWVAVMLCWAIPYALIAVVKDPSLLADNRRYR